MSDFKITQADKDSGLWLRLSAHMKARREELRVRNDSPTLDERTTAATRGRIAELTELLAAETTAPGVDP